MLNEVETANKKLAPLELQYTSHYRDKLDSMANIEWQYNQTHKSKDCACTKGLVMDVEEILKANATTIRYRTEQK